MAGGMRLRLRSLSRIRDRSVRLPLRHGQSHASPASRATVFPSTGGDLRGSSEASAGENGPPPAGGTGDGPVFRCTGVRIAHAVCTPGSLCAYMLARKIDYLRLYRLSCAQDRLRSADMARRMEEGSLRAIEEVVGRHPGGIAAPGIADALDAALPRRTLQYRLKALVDDRRLERAGSGRWARYRLPGGVFPVGAAVRWKRRRDQRTAFGGDSAVGSGRGYPDPCPPSRSHRGNRSATTVASSTPIARTRASFSPRRRGRG